MSLPPHLRVLCRRLAAAVPDSLVSETPALVNQVLYCGSVLSAPQELRGKDKASEAALLVNKLKTLVSTLLNGRSIQGRFAAVVLVKAIIDVGGWECLRSSEPWVRGLLSILQKPDPTASKELCVVTLTRIYTLLHQYQTLVREIATPTLPSFVNACLQLIKPLPSGQPPKTPLSLVESVCGALATIVPLYPTTLRPFSAPIRSSVRKYLAPTRSESIIFPTALQQSSRRLIISLHQTAPKNGSADEWAKILDGLIKACHATSDQVFRAVHESWESASGYVPQTVNCDEPPNGGSDSLDELPRWEGLQSGAERLGGLLETLAECFRCPTKSPVATPIGSLLDLSARLTLITSPAPGSKSGEDVLQMNPAIGREERDELWSVLPDIRVAILKLLHALLQRFGRNVLPLAVDILDQAVRVFTTARGSPAVRELSFVLLRDVLLLAGPTLSKMSVDALGAVIQHCCRDLLSASGHSRLEKDHSPTGTNGAKPKETIANADVFLQQAQNSQPNQLELSPAHLLAAQQLLPVLFSHLPQQHLSQGHRALLDRTAILSHSRDAMLTSCLHPYRDKNGRLYPSILPFLSRRYPDDQAVEVLRSNLLPAPRVGGPVLDAPYGMDIDALDVPVEALNAPQNVRESSDLADAPAQPSVIKPAFGFPLSAAMGEGQTLFPKNDNGAEVENPATEPLLPTITPVFGFPLSAAMGVGPFAMEAEETDQTEERPGLADEPANRLKRRGDEIGTSVPKRVEVGKGKAPDVNPAQIPILERSGREDSVADGDEDDSGGSVHIDMTFDDDDEETDDEESGVGMDES